MLFVGCSFLLYCDKIFRLAFHLFLPRVIAGCYLMPRYYTNSASKVRKENLDEPRHDKTNKVPMPKLRLRSAWASAESDQSLCCPHEETLGP